MSAGEMDDLFGPIRPLPRRSWMPVAVLVLGFLSIVVLLVSRRLGDREILQHLFLERAVDRLELSLARSHLWLEEYLTGDMDVDVDREVWGPLDEALEMSRAMRLGGDLRGGRLEPRDDPVLLDLAARLEEHAVAYRRLSRERFDDRDASGVGSTRDQAYDGEFRSLLSEAERFREQVDDRLERVQRRTELWQQAVIGTWSVIVLVAVIGLFERERRHRAAAEQVQSSRRWLAATLSSIGDAVVTTDLAGEVTYLNPVAEDLLGWGRGEASGRGVEEVVVLRREVDGERVGNPVAAVLRSGERHVSEEARVLEARDGQRRAVDDGAAPIQGQDGELRGAVLVFRDATLRRRAEAELRSREAELRQSQKLEAVGRLAGGIAHDVSNYLGAIRGYCEVAVMKGESGPALERRMESAIDTCHKVAALIRQLLAFSRRQPAQPEVVDLGRVVGDLEALMERLLGEDVTLETVCDSHAHRVVIDPAQAEQALVNLLVNARDAMPRGGRIAIELASESVDDRAFEKPSDVSPGRFVRLSVRDTGTGIPLDLREKIFDPFFSTKGGDHSGLGLATVYGIVRQNGGFLRFESAEDEEEGTIFHLYFPATDREPATVSTREVADTRVAALRVLLVEDNAAMRESTRDLLDALGHEPTVAESAEAALEIFDAGERFDVLLTDVIMPGLSGKDLADRLRSRGDETPVLFMSGYTDRVNLHYGLEASGLEEPPGARPAVHFLEKPFGAADLSAKLRELAPG